MRTRQFPAALYALALLAGFCAPVLGDTKLTLDWGWGDRMRSDRWGPVFVTASERGPDRRARNVMLDVVWPGSGKYLMHVQEALTIGAEPRTFRLLLPGRAYQTVCFTLLDRETGKTLATYRNDQQMPVLDAARFDNTAPFVGISGVKTELATLQKAQDGKLTPAFLAARRVPETALGFDGLDLLVLNAPTLTQGTTSQTFLDDAQQQAIVDWVRAGGNLIIWPGEAGFPTMSPLANVLPARVGDAENIFLLETDRPAIGLPNRKKSVTAYHLEPKAGAEEIRMLNVGQTSAYAWRMGLGRIVLAPFNIVVELPVEDVDQCKNIWEPLTRGMPAFAPSAGGATASSRADAEKRQNDASSQIAGLLGNVPGAGPMESGRILLVLLGIMFIVGPVDSLVLKRLGRRPWTLMTVAGWIGLVTCGGLCGSQLFKRGHAEFKTIRMVDQIDGATVASTDYVSLYSSVPHSYEIKTTGNGWWQPAVTDGGSHNSGLTLDVDFHQTSERNTPEEVAVRAWSERFLRGDEIAPGPAIIDAKLTVVSGHIVGTITNLSDGPLKHIRVAARDGAGVCTLYVQPASATAPVADTATVDEIAPHATVRVDAALLRIPADVGAKIPAESDLRKAALDLNLRRGQQMEALAATGNFAVVYAENDHPVAVNALVERRGVEKHMEFVRALVELHTFDVPGTH